MRQKKKGKKTITDKRMRRFWITLDQAVQLVMNALEYMHAGEIFLPKIPSMKIVDQTRAIAPNCEIEIIAIRSGEKLHKMMTTEEEGWHTVDYNGMYIILPNYSWWNRQNYKTSKKLPKGFTRVSNTNKDWLSVNDLKVIINNYVDTINRNRNIKAGATGNVSAMKNELLNAEIYSNRVSSKCHSLAN